MNISSHAAFVSAPLLRACTCIELHPKAYGRGRWHGSKQIGAKIGWSAVYCNCVSFLMWYAMCLTDSLLLSVGIIATFNSWKAL